MSPETGVTTLCGYLNQVPAAKITCLLSNWGWAMPLTVLRGSLVIVGSIKQWLSW